MKDDRNLIDHSSENEEDEELYLRALLALYNLKDFVRTVDRYEVNIDDKNRLQYRQKYIEKIESLQSVIDEERIELIQKTKQIDRDIQKVLTDDNPLRAWANINGHCLERSTKIDKNMERYHAFVVRASDHGVQYAHLSAASYYALIKRDFNETERRLFMLVQSKNELPPGDAKSIVETINDCLRLGGAETEGINKLIELIKGEGYTVNRGEDGSFEWANKTKETQ